MPLVLGAVHEEADALAGAVELFLQPLLLYTQPAAHPLAIERLQHDRLRLHRLLNLIPDPLMLVLLQVLLVQLLPLLPGQAFESLKVHV